MYKKGMLSINSLSTTATIMAGIGFLSQYVPITSILIVFLKLCGVSSFRIRKDRDRIKGVLKVLDNETRSSSSIFEYGKLRPGGMFIGWRCFGYYNETSSRDECDGAEISIFTTPHYFKSVLDKSNSECSSITFEHTIRGLRGDQNAPKSRKQVSIWSRRGGYENMYYSRLKVDLSMIYPIGDQSYIVQDILEKYREKERLVVFIHGVTGAGKSSIGLLLAKELNGNYSNKFNPIDPGDSFQSLLRDIDVHEDEEQRMPFVIVMEEIDTMIEAVHKGEVVNHKKVTTMIRNKASYNTFFDDMIIYSKIILILTSNKSKEEIDKLDTSYLRNGRVNAYYTMMKPLVV